MNIVFVICQCILFVIGLLDRVNSTNTMHRLRPQKRKRKEKDDDTVSLSSFDLKVRALILIISLFISLINVFNKHA